MPSAALPSEPIAFSRVGGVAQTSESSEDMPSNSVEQIRSIDMYQPTRPQRVSSLGELDPGPRPSPVSPSTSASSTVGVSKEEDVPVPFPKLPGEFLRYFGKVHKAELYVTTYRLFVSMDDKRGFCNIPLTTIDTVEARDMFILQINCKDGRVFKWVFILNLLTFDQINGLWIFNFGELGDNAKCMHFLMIYMMQR